MLPRLDPEDLDQVVGGEMKRSKNPYDWSPLTSARVAEWKAMGKQPVAASPVVSRDTSRDRSRDGAGWLPDERRSCLLGVCIPW